MTNETELLRKTRNEMLNKEMPSKYVTACNTVVEEENGKNRDIDGIVRFCVIDVVPSIAINESQCHIAGECDCAEVRVVGVFVYIVMRRRADVLRVSEPRSALHNLNTTTTKELYSQRGVKYCKK